MKQEFAELRAEGMSYAEIARKLEVSKATVVKWSKECALEVNNLKELRREMAVAIYSEKVEDRLRRLNKLSQKVWGELETRDLSKVKLEKLIDLYRFIQDDFAIAAQAPVFEGLEDTIFEIPQKQRVSWRG